jgi:hypothetical protein
MQMDEIFFCAAAHSCIWKKNYFLDIKHVAPLLTHCPHTWIAQGAEIDQLYLVEGCISSAVQMKLAEIMQGLLKTKIQ